MVPASTGTRNLCLSGARHVTVNSAARDAPHHIQIVRRITGFKNWHQFFPLGGNNMPKYISLMTYTDQGLQTIKKSNSSIDSTQQMAEELGGKIDQIYLTMGNYDIVAIADFPDDATAATFVLRLGGLGNVKATTLKAFQEDAFRMIVNAV
jgi:uncharacterized protein with GYD domain